MSSNPYLDFINSLEEDGFCTKKSKGSYIRMEKNVIWPIDNESIYKIVVSLNKFRSFSLRGQRYDISIKLVNDNNETLISSYFLSSLISEPDSFLELDFNSRLLLIKEILDIVVFITKLFGTYKDRGRILRKSINSIGITYSLLESEIVAKFLLTEEGFLVSVYNKGNEPNKTFKLSDAVGFNIEDIKQNYDIILNK